MIVADTLLTIGLATISLGTIHEEDGMQTRSFWLRNAGEESVILHQGYTSCGCTTILFDKGNTIEPGDSTCITLCFNPRGKGGAFEETGTVVYGPNHKHVQLAMKGTCISSEESLLQQFPIRVSDHLRLSANRFDLGIMRVGESKERGVVILHRDEKNRQERIPVTFTVTKDMKKGLRHIVRTVTTGSKGKKTTINITFDVVIK